MKVSGLGQRIAKEPHLTIKVWVIDLSIINSPVDCQRERVRAILSLVQELMGAQQ